MANPHSKLARTIRHSLRRRESQGPRRRPLVIPSFLVSPTAYKGTIAPSAAARVLAREIRRASKNSRIDVLPLADGGDGTLDVLMSARHGKIMTTKVRGPLGKPVSARWGKVGTTAVIEMARASGLALVKGKNRILEATSFGTGQLIGAALDNKCRTILIGVGGTATADGASGALRALGLTYFEKNGKELSAQPKELIRLHRLDWSGFDKRMASARIVVLCDVANPLLGKRGSARVFGPQKGATPGQVRFLEKFLRRWSSFARTQTKNKPGAGAAGALAFGLSAFAGAKLVQGAPFIMKEVGWKKRAARADVIVTGEGRLDATSFLGKVVGQIIRRARNKPVFAVVGSTSMSSKELKKQGVSNVSVMGPAGLRKPLKTLKKAAQELFRRPRRSI